MKTAKEIKNEILNHIAKKCKEYEQLKKNLSQNGTSNADYTILAFDAQIRQFKELWLEIKDEISID